MAVYYVDSAAANDLGAGTTSETAWKTLALGAALNAGDQVCLKRDGVWREQLTVPTSGVAIGSYGDGAKPIISGADAVSTWTAYTGTPASVFEATFDADAEGAAPNGFTLVQTHGTVTVIAAAAKRGARGMRYTITGTGAVLSSIVDFGAPLTAFYMGFWFRLGAPVASADTYFNFLSGKDGATENIKIQAVYTKNTGNLALICKVINDTPAEQTVGTINVVADTWYWMDIHFASGNGTGIMSFTAGGQTVALTNVNNDATRNEVDTIWIALDNSQAFLSAGHLDIDDICVHSARMVSGAPDSAVNTYSADLATECRVVSIGGTAAVKGVGADILTDHQWIWSGNKLYIADATGDPDTSGVVVTAGQRDYCIADNNTGAITVADIECREANTSFGGCIDVRGNGGVWTIQRCDLTGGAHSGLLMLNDDCVVEDCAITRNGTGVHMHEASVGVLFRRNDVSYNQHPGLNLNCDTGIFEHNEIHHNGWNGIILNGMTSQGISADGNTIRLNIIHDNGQGPAWTDVTNGVEIYIAGGDNNVIIYNLIYGTTSHTNDGGVHLDFGASGNLIAHNTIAGFKAAVRGYGMLIEDGTPGEGGPTINNTVKNNIVANCRILLGVANDMADDMQGNVFDYNCYYGGVEMAVWDGRPSGMTARTLAAWAAASGQDAHSVGADPKLNAKYHLGNGSSAINAGVVIAGIGQVFSGAAPDIGAYEWRRKGNRGRFGFAVRVGV